jgi:hypothetical protein
MKRVFFAVCCLFLSTASFAEAWLGPATVANIYPYTMAYASSEGLIYLQFSAYTPQPGCRQDASGLVALTKANPLFKEIYALLLSAQAQGKQVSYFVDGCSTDGNWPVLKMVQLQSP